FREQPLWIERRNIRREIGNGEREIAGNSDERADANDLVVTDAVDGGNADDLTRERRLFRRRQPIALVCAFFGATAERAAQRDAYCSCCRLCGRPRRARRAARLLPVRAATQNWLHRREM